MRGTLRNTITFGLSIALIGIMQGPVSATTPPPDATNFSGAAAAAYADQWARSYNSPQFQTQSGDDCTNFISQAMYFGGFSFVNYGNYDDAHQGTQAWWYHYYGRADSSTPVYNHSNSFLAADNFKQFLIWDNPGGTYEGTWAPNQGQNTYTPNSVVTGDVIFYRWAGGSVEKHAGIQVGIGTDPVSGWYGNLQDQHSNAHYHAFWSLYPYNSQYSTTYYDFYHIWTGN